MNHIIITFIISMGINLLMFIPAYRFKTDKLTDISYSVTFVVVGFFGLFANNISLPKIILFAMIFIWAFRLGAYLLNRIHKMGKDDRFDTMRSSIVKFGSFWVLQGLTVFVVLIPSSYFFNSEIDQLSIMSYIGLFIWLSGLIIESISDYQKTSFKSMESNKGKWVNIGLWKYSQHPNYLGEIMVWLGVYLFIFPALNSDQAMIGAISPLFITVLLLFVSGIPLLDKSAEKKWGTNSEYAFYKARTGKLLPKNSFILLASIVIAQAAGSIGAIFTVSNMGSWYSTLAKPEWNPPSWVFGPVWTSLYIMMGIAAFLIWKKRELIGARIALRFYLVQLALNTLWSVLFFGVQNPGLAFAEIIVLLLMIIYTSYLFWKVNKSAALLMIPYILWVSFAGILNYTIWQLNI